MDGKKGCKKGEEVAEEGEKGLFIDEGKSSPVLLRGSEQLALVLLMRGYHSKSMLIWFFDSQPGIWEHRKKWVLNVMGDRRSC
jgi:hypothetical protein